MADCLSGLFCGILQGDITNRTLTCNTIRYAGVRLQAVSLGEEAIRRCMDAQAKFDLVLLVCSRPHPPHSVGPLGSQRLSCCNWCAFLFVCPSSVHPS